MTVLMITLIIASSFVLGYFTGKVRTQCECGKMLHLLEKQGFLKPLDGVVVLKENDGEEDN